MIPKVKDGEVMCCLSGGGTIKPADKTRGEDHVCVFGFSPDQKCKQTLYKSTKFYYIKDVIK